MEKVLQSQIGIKERIENIFEKDRNLHILFWVLLTVFLVVIDRSKSEYWIKLIKSLISVGFFGAIVYINWHILIPKFLKQRNWILYILSLMILAIIITPPKSLAFFLLYGDYPTIQQFFLKNQNILLFESIFVGAASAAFKITQDWLAHERDKKELQSQNLASELNFLKSQINPHFLFNTLNNLYALSLKKSDEAPKTVLMLSEMMRYMLYECNAEKVSLQKEIKYLQNYLELEKIRLGKNYKLNFEIEGEIGDLMIAPLMFIPFIENSFKHGINTQLIDAYIDIKMIIDETHLKMIISNSNSINKSTSLNISSKRSGGIGLINIKRRLKLIYPNRHTLKIEDNEEHYKVILSLYLN